MITSMMAPLLEAKERENRKLKRLLSERHGITTEDDLIQSEVIGGSMRRGAAHFKNFPKRQKNVDNSDEEEDGSEDDND